VRIQIHLNVSKCICIWHIVNQQKLGGTIENKSIRFATGQGRGPVPALHKCNAVPFYCQAAEPSRSYSEGDSPELLHAPPISEGRGSLTVVRTPTL
ncbi:uncharacterized protein METZ01_LOCUS407361, partial [marine metagenome]